MKLNTMEIQLYNNLPSYLKNIHLFRRKLKSFVLQHTFHSVVEYLSYELLSYKMTLYIIGGLSLKKWDLHKSMKMLPY